MKKLIVMVMVIALVLSIGIFTAVAAEPPPYNGNVAGIITSDEAGVITGTVSGDYNLVLAGQFTSEFVDQHATFNAAISGDITGTITGGLYCNNGLDTIYGEVIGTGATEPVRIVGVFLKSGIEGDFAGEIITGALPDPVTSLSITTAGDATEVTAGSTLQCDAVMTPPGYDVFWSVWTSDDVIRASIDQNGLLTGLEAGAVTVIANTLDPSLATTTKALTVVNPQTEVGGSVDPVYIIVIPAAVDLGSMQGNDGVISQPFSIEAQNVVLESGYKVEVAVTSSFFMTNMDGHGSINLAYSLHSSIPTKIADGGVFTTFDSNRTEDGTIQVDTADITAAGSYKGTMVFEISYVAK